MLQIDTDRQIQTNRKMQTNIQTGGKGALRQLLHSGEKQKHASEHNKYVQLFVLNVVEGFEYYRLQPTSNST